MELSEWKLNIWLFGTALTVWCFVFVTRVYHTAICILACRHYVTCCQRLVEQSGLTQQYRHLKVLLTQPVKTGMLFIHNCYLSVRASQGTCGGIDCRGGRAYFVDENNIKLLSTSSLRSCTKSITAGSICFSIQERRSVMLRQSEIIFGWLGCALNLAVGAYMIIQIPQSAGEEMPCPFPSPGLGALFHADHIKSQRRHCTLLLTVYQLHVASAHPHPSQTKHNTVTVMELSLKSKVKQFHTRL